MSGKASSYGKFWLLSLDLSCMQWKAAKVIWIHQKQMFYENPCLAVFVWTDGRKPMGIYSESDKDQAKALEGERRQHLKIQYTHTKIQKDMVLSRESTGVTSSKGFGRDPVCLVEAKCSRETSFFAEKYNHTWAYSDIFTELAHA